MAFNKGHIPWNKGTKYSDEYRKKLSDVRKGKPSNRKGCKLSEETKEKIRIAHLGKESPLKGRKMSVEYCKNISERQKGRKLTEEWKENISNSLKGKKKSKKHIKNLSKYYKENPTSIEVKVAEQLEKYKIKYIYQKPLYKGHFFVDFYLPEYQLVIECNGDYWHSLKNRKERDKELESYVKSKGKDILWLWEHEINDDWFDISDYLEI